MMRALFCTLALTLLAGCAGSSAEAPPASAGQVDLQRYQGTWYELARLPMFSSATAPSPRRTTVCRTMAASA